ncbi:MAG: hypothetical protein DRP08_04890 [Candidatus Aenigmatarchaeota archaeon]|nr:MAG: hypothetical protein DRP08_04890 [Candidatus Aenigmarchaeota archaeon]
MSKTVWQIIHYAKLTNGWDVSGTTLTSYHSIKLNISLGGGNDNFSFKISGLTTDIDYEDKVVISRRFDDNSHTGDDILMVGIIRNVSPTKNGSLRDLSIKGYNYSESINNGLVFVDATNLTIPQMFEQAINSLVLASSDYTVTWNSSNPSTKSGGGSFPVVGERLYNKPFRELLDKFSAKDKTADGNYHWYVDEDNTLVWLPDSTASSQVFDEVNTRFTKLAPTKDVNDVRNFVIIKGGLDPKGRVLQDRYADYSSISKHGFKYYILVDENKTAESVYAADKSVYGVDDMADASYPLTPYWSASSIANFSDYADDFRAYIRGILKGIGKTFVDMRKNGRLKVSVDMKPKRNIYRPSDLVSCIFIDDIIPDKDMRINSIDYSTFNDIVVFREDEPSL